MTIRCWVAAVLTLSFFAPQAPGESDTANQRPRVIVSTDGSDSRRHEAEDLQVKVYVEKPVRPEVMRDVLSSLDATAPRA